MSDTLHRLKEELIQHTIKPSYPRMKILEILKERNHPSAEDIYKKLITQIPTLSRTTIYNTLKLFQSRGLIQSLTIEEKETRFDLDTTDHGHFKCQSCGRVIDVPVPISSIQELEKKGYRVDKQELYFRGLCPLCQDKH